MGQGGVTGAAYGAFASILGGISTNNAAKSAAAVQWELARPYHEAAEYALPALRNLASGYFANRLGKENAYLRAGHAENLAQIGRQERTAGAASTSHWMNAGNVGRGRGEQLRIAESALRSRNAENLNYGAQQQQYKDTSAQQLANLYGMLGNLGSQGMEAGIASAQTRLAGVNSMWSGITGGIQGFLQSPSVTDWFKKK
jgi:hypothetical protein